MSQVWWVRSCGAISEKPGIEEVIKKILKHLGLWDRKARRLSQDLDRLKGLPLPPDEEHLYRDPEYPAEAQAA